MQTGSSETLIGWKSGRTSYVPLRDQMEGAWLSWNSEEQSTATETLQSYSETVRDCSLRDGLYLMSGLHSLGRIYD
jgi:hypothetical protein